MKFITQIWEKYLGPKDFEFFGDKTIYDLIGIKFYKKYLPTTGDIIRKRKGIKQIDMGKGEIISQLYYREKETRKYECRHIIGAILFILITLYIDRDYTFLYCLLLAVLNLYINIYPIFLQRHNRIRILKLLKRYGFNSIYTL